MTTNTATLSRRLPLANGLTIPNIHLGVYLMNSKEAHNAVRYALDAGYSRLFSHACPTLLRVTTLAEFKRGHRNKVILRSTLPVVLQVLLLSIALPLSHCMLTNRTEAIDSAREFSIAVDARHVITCIACADVG